MNIDVSNINNINLNVDENLLRFALDDKTNSLTISSDFSPSIVDSNFGEVEKKINEMELEIRNVKNLLNKMENKINILNAVMQVK